MPARFLIGASVGLATFGAALLMNESERAVFAGAAAGLASLAWLAWQGAKSEARLVRSGQASQRSNNANAAIARLPATTLLELLGEPILLVERQLVSYANPAARSLLGEHVVGEDIRLAIRSPIAAERLAAHTVSPDPVEFTGLGDRDRQWAMRVIEVRDNLRLIQLSDRTAAYAAERMRVDFVANASHELRTPLATLLGFLETLEDDSAGNDPATRGRFIKIMFAEAKRMQQLIADLISLSRIEANKFTAPHDQIALAELVSEAALASEAGIVASDHRVVVELGDNIPPLIGDRAQLSQLVHNLISNALKYGKPKSPVVVRLVAAGPALCLTISDQGDGIAAEHLPRLTERFYRVDPGRSRSIGGTGLGLAIVKHIVERHRGQLDIQSEVGQGTSVKVTLPS
jgi:two-component system, OmpR family, phosphate regulon sensor histidine kinase PhoR